MDLIVTGTADAIVMVEAGANGVSEAEVLDALELAHEEIKKLVARCEELRRRSASPRGSSGAQSTRALLESIRCLARGPRRGHPGPRQERAHGGRRGSRTRCYAKSPTEATPRQSARRLRSRAFDKVEKEIIRRRIAVDKKRPTAAPPTRSGRSSRGGRLAPRARLGPLHPRRDAGPHPAHAGRDAADVQRIDGLGIEETKRFMHHYNFPPFSVGEAGFMRGPKRRDIGHGALAERALLPTFRTRRSSPTRSASSPRRSSPTARPRWPASARPRWPCMDAGVPISAPGGRHRDGSHQGGRRLRRPDRHRRRRGPPRRHGLQGRRHAEGITALQMDIKITGVTFEILTDALEQARQGAPVHPRQDDGGHRRAARSSSASARRASCRSRSTPTRSARSSARAARPSAA